VTTYKAIEVGNLRPGGRLVLVALPASGTLRIPVFDTVLNGTSVIGSIVGTRADLIDVFALHARWPDQGELRDQAARLYQRGYFRGAARQGEGTAGP
jgi:D-arabinose 1-dehydrogenase-like Zn-dependent alcohol dehydrogenase